MKKSNYIFWMVTLILLLISLLIYGSMQKNVKEGLSVGQFIDDFKNIAATIKKVTQALIVHERKMMAQVKAKKKDYNNYSNKFKDMKNNIKK
jgi:hypothetical protein